MIHEKDNQHIFNVGDIVTFISEHSDWYSEKGETITGKIESLYFGDDKYKIIACISIEKGIGCQVPVECLTLIGHDHMFAVDVENKYRRRLESRIYDLECKLDELTKSLQNVGIKKENHAKNI